MTVALGMFVTALTIGTAQVAAFPVFYNDRQMGCEIPSMAFEDHMAPVVNPDVVFAITDAAGMPADSFTPGEEYTVSTDAYAATTNAWVHSTAGTPAVLDAGDIAACGLAWYSTEDDESHSFVWTAPQTTECVTISAAQATDSMDAYNTATVEFCPESIGAAALEPASTPDAAPSASVPGPMTDVPAGAATGSSAGPAATEDMAAEGMAPAPAPSSAVSLAAVVAAGAAFAVALF